MEVVPDAQVFASIYLYMGRNKNPRWYSKIYILISLEIEALK
jgi:hypothetical protein